MPHSISAFQAAYIGIEVLIALVSVPGNVLVIWAVKVNQALRDATFCFIVSLAVADVAVGALVIPLAILINIGPQTHFYTCLMVACPVLILTQSSILALLAIAVDRYLRVKIPLSYFPRSTQAYVSSWVTGHWFFVVLLSLSFSTSPLPNWSTLSSLPSFLSFFQVGKKSKKNKMLLPEFVNYLPFTIWVTIEHNLYVIIYICVCMCSTLIRKQLNKKVSGSSGDPQKYYGKELKIAKSLALILFLFALSWLPLHTLNCITLFCPDCQKPSILTYIAIFLTHGNSAMNPIVYAFRIQKFRTTFLQIWNQHFRCRAVPPSDDEDPPEERLDN
uniref:Adenosine receptor A1 n=2 Tax=Didelphinae TaxID=126287 RepID=F7AY59_MONDO